MCCVYSIGFSFLAQIPLWISRGEKNPNKPAWIYKKNFIVFTKDHSYFHLQYLPLNPRAHLMPGPQLSFPDAGARPHKPQETFISIKRHLDLRDVWCGRDLTLCSIPGAPCRSPMSTSPTPSDVQLEQWLSPGPRARLSSRLQASSGHHLPVTVAVPLSVCLEQQQYN